jgi:hypothetical protein
MFRSKYKPNCTISSFSGPLAEQIIFVASHSCTVLMHQVYENELSFYQKQMQFYYTMQKSSELITDDIAHSYFRERAGLMNAAFNDWYPMAAMTINAEINADPAYTYGLLADIL